MKIKCTDNKGLNIPKDFFELTGWSENMIFELLSINKIYNVYAVFTIQNNRCFLICDDLYDGDCFKYPTFYPASLFEIIDNTPSQYWITKENSNHFQKGTNNMGFPNIINEEFFNGNLVEGYEREEEIFDFYKNLIDKECEI
jgi:hypothetical protein